MAQAALILYLIGISILAAGGLFLYRKRANVNVLHIGAVILVILGATSFFAMGGVAQSTDNTIQYQVRDCNGSDLTTPRSGDIREFESLSPEAKEIFIQAVEQGGEYETSTRPDDLVYLQDVTSYTEVNFVRYNGECHAFIAETPMTGQGLAVAILFPPLFILGASTTAIGIYGLRKERSLLPTAVVAGLIPISILVIGYTQQLFGWMGWMTVFGVLLTGLIVGVGTWMGLNRRMSKG